MGEAFIKPCGVKPERVDVAKLGCGFCRELLSLFCCPKNVTANAVYVTKVSVEALNCDGELELIAKAGLGRKVASDSSAELTKGFGGFFAANDQNRGEADGFTGEKIEIAVCNANGNCYAVFGWRKIFLPLTCPADAKCNCAAFPAYVKIGEARCV